MKIILLEGFKNKTFQAEIISQISKRIFFCKLFMSVCVHWVIVQFTLSTLLPAQGPLWEYSTWLSERFRKAIEKKPQIEILFQEISVCIASKILALAFYRLNKYAPTNIRKVGDYTYQWFLFEDSCMWNTSSGSYVRQCAMTEMVLGSGTSGKL